MRTDYDYGNTDVKDELSQAYHIPNYTPTREETTWLFRVRTGMKNGKIVSCEYIITAVSVSDREAKMKAQGVDLNTGVWGAAGYQGGQLVDIGTDPALRKQARLELPVALGR